MLMPLRVSTRRFQHVGRTFIGHYKKGKISPGLTRGFHMSRPSKFNKDDFDRFGKDEKLKQTSEKLKNLNTMVSNESKKLKDVQDSLEKESRSFRRLLLHAAIAATKDHIHFLNRQIDILKDQVPADSTAAPQPKPNMTIKFDDDPLKLENAERHCAVIDSLVQVTSTEDETSELTDADIYKMVETTFNAQYGNINKVSMSEKDFNTYLTLFSSLRLGEVGLSNVELDNPGLNGLFNAYKQIDGPDAFEKILPDVGKLSEELKIPEPVVLRWLNTFETISTITPLDQSSIDGVHKSNEESKEHQNIFDFVSNSNGNKSSKNDKNKSKNDKNTNKNRKEFVIDLNRPPMQFFQLGILVGLVVYTVFSLSKESNHELSFQEFTSQFLNKNLVNKLIIVNNRTAIIDLNDNGKAQYPHGGHYYFTIGSIESFERSLQHVQNELHIDDALRIPVVYTSEGSTAKLLINFLPTVLFLGAIYYMSKKAGGGMGGPLGFGKSTAKKFNQETDIKIRFKDVAGMSEAKEEVMEFVKFLQNPEKYEKLGAKIPRGAILSGPPGTGKTLIAKATAGEAGVPFYSVSGSEFVEMFVGVGASRVRDLFKTARENAPSIVFVDEIDAIGKQRSKGNASGANDERETTLNQLLVEMDGFESSDHVVVLAGTNRADILDRALMRPGRFDRHIAIDNPELQGRKEIFQVHLKKIKLVENIDDDLPGRLAALTPGFSGADIANVCNEAALIGARFNAEAVTLRHFELAIERVIGGVEKKSKILNAEEQKIVAYHEAGHAVCGWYLKYAHPLLKVSIIPRGQGALGYAQYLPPDQYLLSGLQLYDRMIMTLGGRVSEELHFSSVTSGAHDDFKKVTNIAQSMVLRFGMSKKVGMVNYADTRASDDLTKPFSDLTNKLIDEEIQRIVGESYQRCKELLKEKSHEVELVAQELLKKEFITREDMIRLLGKRPFPETNDAFDKYLDGKAAFKNEQPENEKKDDEK